MTNKKGQYENDLKRDFKKSVAKGAGYALGGAVVCGVIGLIFAGPAGGIAGLQVGAGLGGAGGTVS